ncbi:MAG: hypothetical protein ACRELF_10560, partial [Gemmataceae bacterium]
MSRSEVKRILGRPDVDKQVQPHIGLFGKQELHDGHKYWICDWKKKDHYEIYISFKDDRLQTAHGVIERKQVSLLYP